MMADNDGEVYLGQHGYAPLLAGKTAHAHSWAVFDILRAGGDENRERLTNEIHQALEHRRFRVIVLDRVDPWLEQDLGRYYRRAGPALDQDALWTLTGYRTRPRWIYLPQ